MWLTETNKTRANMAPSLIISTTGAQRGYGCDQYKTVIALTDAEKQAAKNGERVFFKAARLSRGRTGTFWRVVKTTSAGVFCPRVPTPNEIAALEAR